MVKVSLYNVQITDKAEVKGSMNKKQPDKILSNRCSRFLLIYFISNLLNPSPELRKKF